MHEAIGMGALDLTGNFMLSFAFVFESFLDASASKVPTKLHENQDEEKLAKHAVDRIEEVLTYTIYIYYIY